MIYRISIQVDSKGIDREVYSLHLEAAEALLIDEGYRCVRKADDGVTALWLKDEAETVFHHARTLKAQIHEIKTID
jgi:hypothetical protein